MAIFKRLDPILRQSITFDNDTCFAHHTVLRDALTLGCRRHQGQMARTGTGTMLAPAARPEFQREVQRFQANVNLTSLPRF